MDPFVVLHALPAEPRAWFLGSAPSTFTSRWREWLVHRIGGLLPVWRGGIGVERHVASARAVLANGGVFVQMPEGTVSGPPGRLGPFRIGWALIALRTRAPIVPFAMAGTDELYVGRRMASRILPSASVEDLLGVGVLPPVAEGSREELDLARRLSDALAVRLGPVVEELHSWTLDPPAHPRRLRRRLTWLLLRPGRLDRDG
jgi:1-acyl-sn-glycerol-3-phosphate acyltransferase